MNNITSVKEKENIEKKKIYMYIKTIALNLKPL